MPNRLLDALTCAPGQDPAKTTHGETLKWGTGIRWEYQTDEQGVGPLLLCGEDLCWPQRRKTRVKRTL